MTQQPTAESEGTETRACSVCGAAETRSIEKLPPPEDNGSESAPNVFERIIQWFRDLFARIAAIFRF